MAAKTYYDILEVAPTATQEQIREAYRFKAAAYHTDKFPKDSRSWQMANEKMKEINSAYEVLKEPSKREVYDKGLKKRRATTEEEQQRRREKSAEARRGGHQAKEQRATAERRDTWKPQSIYTDEQWREYYTEQEQVRQLHSRRWRMLAVVVVILVSLVGIVALSKFERMRSSNQPVTTTASLSVDNQPASIKQIDPKVVLHNMFIRDKRTGLYYTRDNPNTKLTHDEVEMLMNAERVAPPPITVSGHRP